MKGVVVFLVAAAVLLFGIAVMTSNGDRAVNQPLVAISTPVVATERGGETCAIPVHGAELRSDGMYESPRTRDDGSTYPHHALDIFAPIGTQIYAVQAGKVIDVEQRDPEGWGQIVFIRHNDGTTALYGHISAWFVSVGQHVERGQLVALIGDQGNARGTDHPHLHLEIGDSRDGIDPPGRVRYKVNPEVWLKACGGWDPVWSA